MTFTKDNQPPPTEREPAVHLLRGAPAVRSWSKHHRTTAEWTLCGIHRNPKRKDYREEGATEKAEAVTCRYCLGLMGAMK